jgi:ATP-dependent protease Clp ATPase subunit
MCNCSACGMEAKEAKKLIAINAVKDFFICDKCILFCVDILNTQEGIETTTITLVEYQRLLAVEREIEPTLKRIKELKNIILSFK